MTDIQQWRRMVHPSRATTPDEAFTAPKTPRKRVRPKLSSLFSIHAGTGTGPTKYEPIDSDYLSMPRSASGMPVDLAPHPDPEAEHLMDTLMSKLLNYPYTGLDSAQNSSLLLIFESYRILADGKEMLQKKLNEEIERRHVILVDVGVQQKQWDEEKREYLAEIKKLEVMIAKGSRGLENVMRARQDSTIRRRDRHTEESDDEPTARHETVYEFLIRDKRDDDEMRKSQRVLVRPRPTSPSARMRTLSHEMSKTSFHNELPFGTPPFQGPSTLAQASFLEQQADETQTRSCAQSLQDQKAAMSDDTFSTFSSLSDFLPVQVQEHTTMSRQKNAEDIADIRRIATLLSKRRGVSVDSVVPKIMELFQDRPRDASDARRLSATLDSTAAPAKSMVVEKTRIAKPGSFTQTNFSRPVQLLQNRAGKGLSFFNRKKPQLRVDTLVEPDERRFSFEPGDDTAMGEERRTGKILRRSFSLDSLPLAKSVAPMAEPRLARVVGSPLDSPASSRRSSKIPSPALTVTSLTRPRREDSTSSLLTAVMYSDEVPRPSSSIYSHASLSSSRISSSRQSSGGQCANNVSQTGDSGYMVSLAAARAAGAAHAVPRSSSIDLKSQYHSKQSSAQGKTGSRSPAIAQLAELGARRTKENVPPTG